MATTDVATYGERRAGRPPGVGTGGRRAGERARNGDARLSRALGWFSIGLGMAELAAPRMVARAIGLSDRADRRALLRAFGLREIASGVGILSRPTRPGPVWSRVGGDAMDLTALGSWFRARDADASRLTTATMAVAGVTALDVLVGARLRRAGNASIETRRSLAVNKPRSEVSRAWRDFRNFPRFMRHLESVHETGDGRSHWVAKGPLDARIEWDAEMTEDQPDSRIAWRSVSGADVDNAGTVEFLDAPGGAVGAAVAKLFGEEPGQQVAGDLRRLKQILETGEIATSRGPSARTRPSIYGEGEAR